MSELRKTALSDWHAAHGGRLVDFAGWSMPIQYSGVLAEHQAVRTACGIFDVSHMAEIRIAGPGARQAIDGLVTNDVSQLLPGAALYTALCREDGGILDDLLVYALAQDELLVVANASNREKVVAWLRERVGKSVRVSDETDDTALIALQGPSSQEILRRLPRFARCLDALDALSYYHATTVRADGMELLLSRTGYTGEWGYELYVRAVDAEKLWQELLATGSTLGLVPCGLGARDTLRLEAGFSLYGHELSEETTPLEAGIGWVVRWKKTSDFVGRAALTAQKAQGVPRRTIPLLLPGRNIARQGAEVLADGKIVGVVCSGSFSPTLERGIALARVESSAADAALSVDIRGKIVNAEHTKLPFVPNRTRG